MVTNPRIGTMIRRARERKRMSQEDLAHELGVSRSAVNAWERDRAYPRSSVGALEDVLGVTLDGQPPPEPAIVPTDEWEASVLDDKDLPAEWKIRLVRESRAARAEYVRLKRERRAAQARQEAGRSDPGRAAG
jgi:transcriptional regulator with XRE-family HTH domain